MIVLKSVDEHIDVILEEAANAQEGHAFVCYEDVNVCSGERHYGSKDTLTTGATAATICSAPAADRVRLVKHISYFNDDDEAKTPTIRIDNGTTTPALFKATIDSKDQIFWTPESGWKVLTSAGLLKTTAHAHA